MLSIIVAVSENGVIGNRGEIPWRLSDDLKRFASLTKGHVVVMGRKTYESIVKKLGGPLKDRVNIVITRQEHYGAPGAHVAPSLQSAVDSFGDKSGGEVFVIGGAEIYREVLPKTDRVYKTLVHTNVAGDAFFPELNENEWRLVSSEFHPKDNRNEYGATYTIYERQRII